MRRMRLGLIVSGFLAITMAGASFVHAADNAPPSEAIKQLRRIFFTNPDVNVLTFHSTADFFHTIGVHAPPKSQALEYELHEPDFSYSFAGEKHDAGDFLERTYTNALLIMKDDKIVYEKYRNFTDAKTHFLSMSTAKSFTSVLVGIALDKRLIDSVDDQITKYVPELVGSAYDGVTIKNALMMKSGVDRADVYDARPGSAMASIRERAMVLNEARATDEALVVKRLHEPGTTFTYSTLDTTVLGWVIEKAAGEPLPSFMEKVLWAPLGTESDGFWIADGPKSVGRATNGMGFNAVLRDYARFGQMMLHEGAANGHQIISQEWVQASTIPEGPEPQEGAHGLGYQYQWWTLTNSNAYMAIGLQGQFIYVDPDTRTVVVKLSYFPLDKMPMLEKESEAYFRAVSKWQP